jgi:lysophospholipase L1-like esterase
MRRRLATVLGAVACTATLVLSSAVAAQAAVTSATCLAAKAGSVRAECPHAVVKANEVLFIGDSFLALSRAIPRNIQAHARAIGAIGPNESYRDASVSGAVISQIAQSYSTEQARSPVKVVIMDGIGNDMLRAGCAPSDSCAAIANAVNTTKSLFAKMASDGTVQDVVWMWYPLVPNNANLNALEQFIEPKIKALCDASTVKCHWVPLASVWAGHSDYSSDGLHPTEAGAKATADAVWAKMQADCVAQ